MNQTIIQMESDFLNSQEYVLINLKKEVSFQINLWLKTYNDNLKTDAGKNLTEYSLGRLNSYLELKQEIERLEREYKQ
jgi:hypothetical protein